MQRKPVLHARDHLPGGADPLPLPNQAAAPAETVPGEVTPPQASPDEHYHWWRFITTDSAPPSPVITTPDVGTNNPAYRMDFNWMGMFDDSMEVTFGHPGPTPGSVSLHRVKAGGGLNPDDYFRGAMPIGHLEWGAGGDFTLQGWFKFDELGSKDVYNFTPSAGSAHWTYLLLNGGGGVTINRDGTAFSSPGGLIQAGVWAFIVITVGQGRLRVYVNPGAPETSAFDPVLGTEFPFTGPMAMDTWGLANGDYSADQLAEKLTSNGFRTAVVQLNASYGPGHAAYIAKLAADVATLQAAGLQVVGWGEVDGTTGADLTATGVDGWMPQIEGDGQRLAVISALGAGVGAGLPKAVVATSGGLDTPAKVSALIAAGIDAAAVEVYAELGAYPYANVDVMLNSFENNGFNAQKLIPMIGTYRAETPDDYAGLDESYLPNYGIYNVPQTSDAGWAAFGALNGGGGVTYSRPVIDVPDPMVASLTGPLSIGAANNRLTPWGDGTFVGYAAEIVVYEHAISSAAARDQYLSGKYGGGGGGGGVPPSESIPPGGLTPGQVAPGAEGQWLVTKDGRTVWADPLLDDLADVDTGGVADGDALVYDSASASWGPGAASGGGGFDLVYNGGWEAGTTYTDGDIVSHEGTLYLCVRTTTAEPTWP